MSPLSSGSGPLWGDESADPGLTASSGLSSASRPPSAAPLGAVVIRCRDPVRAFNWLRSAFGFEEVEAPPAHDAEVLRELRGMGTRVLLLSASGGEGERYGPVAVPARGDCLAPRPVGSVTPRVEVGELEEVYRRVVLLRSAIHYPLTEGPPGRGWFVCRDPEGNPWEVVGTRPPTRQTTERQTRILREWTGVAIRSRAGSCVAHLLENTFPQLRAIPGCLDARIAQRDVAEGTEFRVATEWDSMEAIRRFVGPDPDVAVVPPEVQEMMVYFDQRARHYELVQEEL